MSQALIHDFQTRAEVALDACLPTASHVPARLHTAMRYATLGGGKRIRPVLVYATGQVLGVELSALDAPACAVELIHAYSLIHDDLPAMDNDDLRRGRPTCHRAFDEATAILAGDALQALAFRILVHDPKVATSAENRLKMIDRLADASGSRGMAGGQALDLEAVGKELNVVELENIHIHKTGALIRASIALGALAKADIEPDLLEKLDRYGKCIGLAFQIQDDILDVEGATEVIGKTQGSDIERNKPTYPQLLGMAGAKQAAADMLDEALHSLDTLGEAGETLRWIANYIVKRNK